jgi:hypothetical protein
MLLRKAGTGEDKSQDFGMAVYNTELFCCDCFLSGIWADGDDVVRVVKCV